ncbi:phosphatase domain-containing putative toxin [Aquisphaera insulae]|uniref:phosphatase domain-containing putative toxin n=1 Tax=Aquisphaera insulae TaxID=2712864 RepID=UPI00202E513A|nr:tyrosine-protein phosphatase [Aquisphaera insulae]
MPPNALARTLREQHIRTVLNLRGSNPRERWYRDELRATLDAGATQVDIPLSSCVWMSRIQLRTLVKILESSEYPLIVHCAWGSERTGLTAAISELLRPGGTIDSARAQLAIRYLYVPLGDGKIMGELVEQYAGWVRERGLSHDPSVFRRWVESGYLPGKPSREAWPYDPTPLSVVTRPGPADRSIATGPPGSSPGRAERR